MLRIMVFALTVLMTSAHADQMHHEFKNPSFSGNGYSAHVLSIEQLQYSRKNDVKDDEKNVKRKNAQRANT